MGPAGLAPAVGARTVVHDLEGTARGSPSARKAVKISLGVALLSVVALLFVLPQALDTCARGHYFKINAQLLTADTCTSDEDCKPTCPQGDFCLSEGIAYREVHRSGRICACRELGNGPSCSTDLECQERMHGVRWCYDAWLCKPFPGSTEGSCECGSNSCATDFDCPPSPGCARGRTCEHRFEGDAGLCRCMWARDVDGGQVNPFECSE